MQSLALPAEDQVKFRQELLWLLEVQPVAGIFDLVNV